MTELDLYWRPSPNFNNRPAGVEPSLVVIHGTAGTDAGDLAWLTSPQSKLSYHYLITRNGRIYYLVREMHRAWHAGKSSWGGVDGVNDFSIGIALSNRGPHLEPHYTDAQYESLGLLLTDLRERRGIHSSRGVVGHAAVSPGRKSDPWAHFDWFRVARDIMRIRKVDPEVVTHPRARRIITRIRY